MPDYVNSASLLFSLLNPFLVIIYLVDVIGKLEPRQFARVLLRAGLIASAVFSGFAILGDAVFSRFMHAEFGSFQMFGGLIFLLIGLQFVFRGPTSIELLRGESQHLAGAIAMPVLIGPGTISGSVVVGQRHDPLTACVIVVVVVFLSILVMLGLKWLHDVVRQRYERLVERYIEIVGRIAALYIGTVAIEMIMQGLKSWVARF